MIYFQLNSFIFNRLVPNSLIWFVQFYFPAICLSQFDCNFNFPPNHFKSSSANFQICSINRAQKNHSFFHLFINGKKAQKFNYYSIKFQQNKSEFIYYNWYDVNSCFYQSKIASSQWWFPTIFAPFLSCPFLSLALPSIKWRSNRRKREGDDSFSHSHFLSECETK